MRPLEPTTDTERYFFGELAKVLAPDEHVVTCAYVRPSFDASDGWATFALAARGRSAFVAITERRVVFVWTRIGVGAPLRENQGVDVIERAAIVGAGIVPNRKLAGADVLVLEGGRGGVVRFDVTRATRHVTAQADFFDRVIEWWPRSAGVDQEAELSRRSRRSLRLGLVVGIALGIAVVVWRVVAGG